MASNLPEKVVWFSLIVGTVLFGVGLLIAIFETVRRKQVADDVKTIVKKAAEKANTPVTNDNKDSAVAEQGAVADTIESVSKLATSLKDLDVGTRVLILGVALYAIAAVAAGVDSIASAVK